MTNNSCAACQHYPTCPEPGRPCHLFAPADMHKTHTAGEQAFGGVAVALARYGIESPKGLE